MKKSEFIQKWIQEFAPDISKSFYKKWIKNGYIWHVFSYEKIPKTSYLTGDDARQAYDKLRKEDVLVYLWESEGEKIEYFSEIYRYSSDINEMKEVNIVDRDWSWSYIQTHEEGLGPYFIKKNI